MFSDIHLIIIFEVEVDLGSEPEVALFSRLLKHDGLFSVSGDEGPEGTDVETVHVVHKAETRWPGVSQFGQEEPVMEDKI